MINFPSMESNRIVANMLSIGYGAPVTVETGYPPGSEP